jgi:hypothetical protein
MYLCSTVTYSNEEEWIDVMKTTQNILHKLLCSPQEAKSVAIHTEWFRLHTGRPECSSKVWEVSKVVFLGGSGLERDVSYREACLFSSEWWLHTCVHFGRNLQAACLCFIFCMNVYFNKFFLN